MPEPTATDAAVAEGAKVAPLPGMENLSEEFRAIERELNAAAGDDPEMAKPDGELDKTKGAERGEDGKFKAKADAKPEEKKGTEGKLTIKERVELREEKRRIKEAFSSREQQLSQREQQLAMREQSTAQIAKARELFEAGDYDGAAAAAFGAKSWNDLNDQAARSFASPEYKRVKELEKKTAELSAERERERQAQQIEAQQAREQKVLADYRAGLAQSLPKAEDETIAALAAEDPAFVDAVFHRVVTAARQGEDLDPVEVAEELVEHARAHYERVSKVFGGRPTSKVEAAKAAPPDRAGSTQQPVKPHKHVSRSTATDASAPQEFKDDAEWLAFGTKAFKRAWAEDDARRELERS